MTGIKIGSSDQCGFPDAIKESKINFSTYPNLDQYQPITQHAHAVRHLNHSCIIILFVYLFVYIISHVSALALILKTSEQVAANEMGLSSQAGCNELGWTLGGASITCI